MPTKPRNVALEQIMRVSTIGTNYAIAVGGMALLGWGLDYWLKTQPWCLLSGVFVGIIGGGYRFIRDARQASQAASDQARRSGATYQKIQDEPPVDSDHNAP